ncbi:MAG: response regulator, partial [Sphingobium sp.]
LLPRVDKTPALAVPQGVLAQIPQGLKVLLVEDNLQVLHFAEQLLRDLGTEVTVAQSGADALRLQQEQPFDLVFTDVVMPGLSGIDLARQLHIRAPELPVLLATGYSEQMVGEGASPFLVLQKPYGVEALSAAIRTLLTPGLDADDSDSE